ncbi:DUF805 domain-containing protein [Macrococcus animalis]|uniref:DUF805 domain-containing protein n=1 Tax=Macrococcus animalis TaxID=3395467 RepID=UPI0039BE4F6B
MNKHISYKKALLDFWRRSLDFEGRSTRKEYWFPMLLNLTILLGVWSICVHFDRQLGINPDDKWSISNIIYKTLSFFVSIGVLSVSVRRLHDTNLSGIIAIIPGVITICIVGIGLLLNQFGINAEHFMRIVLPIVLIVMIIFYIVLLLRDGTYGPNEYGEDPFDR